MRFHRFAAAIALTVLLGTHLSGSSSRIWLDVPFVRQPNNGCGAASILMLLHYWSNQGFAPGEDITEIADIQKQLYAEGAQGIWGSDVEAYLRSRGFQTFVFAGRWRDLLQHLSQGRPLMVCLRDQGAESNHYVVVAGLDEPGRLVLVNDPQGRKLAKIHQARFEKDWEAADRWTLLALPQKQ